MFLPFAQFEKQTKTRLQWLISLITPHCNYLMDDYGTDLELQSASFVPAHCIYRVAFGRAGPRINTTLDYSSCFKELGLAQNLAQPFMIRIICSGSFVSTRPSWPNTDFNIQRFSVQSGGISPRVAAIVLDVTYLSFHWMNYFSFGPTLGSNWVQTHIWHKQQMIAQILGISHRCTIKTG